MSALVLCRTFPPMLGGLERYTSELLRRTKYPVTVVAPAFPGSRQFDAALNYPVRRFPTPASWLHGKRPLLPLAAWAVQAAMRERPSVVVSDQVQSAGVGLPLARTYGIPHLLFAYGREIQRPSARWAKSYAFKHSDVVIVISEFTRRLLQERFGVPPERIRLVRPGVDTNWFVPTESKEPIRAELGLPREAAVLLTAGRLSSDSRYKGFDRILRMTHSLITDLPDLTVCIVGDGNDRPYLEDLARSTGIEKNVRFCGRVSDAQFLKLYQAADLFVLPSGSADPQSVGVEGYGIVFAEAASCGLPTVAYGVGGVTDVVVDGETGRLVPPDEIALRDEVLHLLMNPMARSAMAVAAREHALLHLGWQQSAREFSAILNELTGSIAATDPRGRALL